MIICSLDNLGDDETIKKARLEVWRIVSNKALSLGRDLTWDEKNDIREDVFNRYHESPASFTDSGRF